ncbi:MAG: alpha/beta hydrolase [Bacillota bacterium]|jgi:alpha-beta hydrolase superfamily lysophospholipase|nr:alpha/beta hydrolase [Bacillota bacterium]HHU42722.1 alpha/beta hydrolase [Clostridiales bacterium]
MKQVLMDTFDKKKISVNIWDKVENIKGAIVISHGMAEHPDRYDDFAKFMNKSGFVVVADDHRGHRFSAAGEKGQVDGDSFTQTIKDMDMLVEYAKATYNAEVTLLGHSYGSFLSQAYLEKYSNKLKGVVLSGTAYMKSPLLASGLVIASMQNLLFGPDKPGKLIDKLSFGAYNKPFESQGQKFAWLSRDPKQVEKYEKDPYCGYVMSIGFYRSFFKGIMGMYGEDAKNINKKLPILIAVGSDDPVSQNARLANKLYEFYKKLGLNVEYKVYEGARHEILNETNNAEVYEDFKKFIEGLYN